MGLLNGMLGNILGGMLGGGSGAQAQNPLLQIALQILQQNGGLEGLLGKFQQAGYADEAQSWVSTGQNRPISGEVLEQVLGQGHLGQIAQQLGVGQREAAGGLASVLPQIIDQMTPQGELPQGGDDLVSQALAILSQTKTG